MGSFILEQARVIGKPNTAFSQITITETGEVAKQSTKGRFDELFISFEDLLGKLPISAIVKKCLEKSKDMIFINKSKAKMLFLENFRHVYFDIESLNEMVARMTTCLKEIYFIIIPNILKAKVIGRLKERERMQGLEVKPESTQWEFKLRVLQEHFKTKIVNFDGRVNHLLEQIFEVLNTNYIGMLLLVEEYKDNLETSTRLLVYSKTFIGGFNTDHFALLAKTLIQKYTVSFFDFFYSFYLPINLDFYVVSWANWFQNVRKAIHTFPEAHLFLSAFRTGLNRQELRKYSMRVCKEIGKQIIISRNDKLSNFSKQKEKVRMRSGLAPRTIISMEVLEEYLGILSFKSLGEEISQNKYLLSVFEGLINKSKEYLQKKEMDPKNMSLLFLFLTVYGLLVPHLLSLCRVCVTEYELNHQYFFMTGHMLDHFHEAYYLESNAASVAIYFHVLEHLNCILPSVVYFMFQKSHADAMDQLLSDFHATLSGVVAFVNEDSTDSTVSPFMDRLSVVPIVDFNFFLKVLVKTTAFREPNTYTTFSTTLAVLDISIDELKESRSEMEGLLSEFLKEDLEEQVSVLVLVTTSISSLYDEKRFSEFGADLWQYLDARGPYLDRYCDTLEKMTHFFAETAIEKNSALSDRASLVPLLVNDARPVNQFLIANVKQDAENAELLDAFIDNSSIYFLWKKLEPEQFELHFSKEIDGFVANTKILDKKFDRVLKFKKIGLCLQTDLKYIEEYKERLLLNQKFAELVYLKGFFKL